MLLSFRTCHYLRNLLDGIIGIHSADAVHWYLRGPVLPADMPCAFDFKFSVTPPKETLAPTVGYCCPMSTTTAENDEAALTTKPGAAVSWHGPGSSSIQKHDGDTPRPVQTLSTLLVEDDPNDAELVLRELRKGGFEPRVDVAETEETFREHVHGKAYDIILADYSLPSWNGMATIDVLKQEGLDIPVVVVSGFLGELKAVECIKQGAADYVLKDHLPRLPESVRRALAEKRLRDEHRRAQQDLARSNRDLEQFAYVASHDLQEPLRMVATYAQLLAERYQGKLDDNADKYIHYVVDGALRMQTLVQDLLAFSRVGRQGGAPAIVNCATIIDLALKNLAAAIKESGAHIQYEQLPTIFADCSQFTQLFQNLIGNAIKFHGAEPPSIHINAEESGKGWCFAVSDNGIGIAPEHAELVFAIFKRLHTREEYPGSGIGLAICKKIVEQHGGRIWVESQPGRGCTFKFTLPATNGKVSHDQLGQKQG